MTWKRSVKTSMSKLSRVDSWRFSERGLRDSTNQCLLVLAEMARSRMRSCPVSDLTVNAVALNAQLYLPLFGDQNYSSWSHLFSFGMLADLSQYTVANFPSRLYCIPNFLSATEERDLCDLIYASPIPKWVTLSGRRLQNWGGIPHPKGMLSEPIPPWLTKFVDRVSALGVFGSHSANHVLINEYKPGQGISGEMAHWLESEFIYRMVCGSNLTSASRLPLSRLEQPGSIPALVLPSGDTAIRHRKGATADKCFRGLLTHPFTVVSNNLPSVRLEQYMWTWNGESKAMHVNLTVPPVAQNHPEIFCPVLEVHCITRL
ncbi:Alpha-ketoglutarate-dependent dioxygenase alkB 6 [Clonorchis sinensis]|uniref:Alpha-ketoglutarate-dependent dioxygenase alkB 6 n=1 Tax=Clonorchis sinensis TaxID=79923 RepID=A0A419Q1W0_CLOSI|nr:Alpha-ketoglutarate-dependent dioxygenase alkB 6 [Clonorchis sinensis]